MSKSDAARDAAHDAAHAAVFAALADPTRRGVLELLRDEGERTAGGIAQRFPAISRPAVSRHLRVLRESGLVRASESGREWLYRLDAAALAGVYSAWFEPFVPLWEESLARLKRTVEDAPASRGEGRGV